MPKRTPDREVVGWRTTVRVDDDTGELIVEERELYRDELHQRNVNWATEPMIVFPGGSIAPMPPPSR